MIKSACGTEQFAFTAVHLSAAVHAIVPIMFFFFNTKFHNAELQQWWYLFNFVLHVLHCNTNLTKWKVESNFFLWKVFVTLLELVSETNFIKNCHTEVLILTSSRIIIKLTSIQVAQAMAVQLAWYIFCSPLRFASLAVNYHLVLLCPFSSLLFHPTPNERDIYFFCI